MFKKLITECFEDWKYLDVSEAKEKFGILWAVCAGKRIKLTSGEDVELSFIEISTELSEIFNEWFKTKFTQDAFVRAYNHKHAIGEDKSYDEVLVRLYRSDACKAIVVVHNACFIPSIQKFFPFCETNVVSGEQRFFKQEYKNGKPIGEIQRITAEEYESICYETR